MKIREKVKAEVWRRDGETYKLGRGEWWGGRHSLGACDENPSLVPGLFIPESERSVGVITLETLHNVVLEKPVDPGFSLDMRIV